MAKLDLSTDRTLFRANKAGRFTTRRYASVVYAMALCLSVCLSQVGVLLKRLEVGSR